MSQLEEVTDCDSMQVFFERLGVVYEYENNWPEEKLILPFTVFHFEKGAFSHMSPQHNFMVTRGGQWCHE
jgi:hypothetical protein